MDTVDKLILQKIQKSFPITERPYLEIGASVGCSEQDAFERVGRLIENRVIRRIGGVFDSGKLGYVSTLGAAKVPMEKIEGLASFVESITEITHHYLRNHEFNIWFTIIAENENRLNDILQSIRAFLETDAIFSLPSLRKFKVSVFFDMNPEKKLLKKLPNVNLAEPSAGSVEISERQKTLIRQIQEKIPNGIMPFKEIAEELGWAETDVLSELNHLKTHGGMKRFGAILYHQKAGFAANAMGVWKVPENKLEEIGQRFASFEQVSHCYARKTMPGFDFNLYTMVHGSTDEACRSIMDELARDAGLTDYDMLFSLRELKKSSMKYFLVK